MTTVATEPVVSGRRARLAATGSVLRRNWLFSLVFLVGLVVRALVMIAYREPFIQPDSHRYLHAAIHMQPDFNRTSGYSLLVQLIPGWRDVTHIPPVQHVLGLVMGVLIYLMLVRRTVPRWGAALATVPVLLDPYQVALEHYILTDTSFEFFMLLGFFLLTFRRRIPWWLALIAGILIGCATVTRSVGDILVVVAALVLLIGQARWLPAVAIVIGTIAPVAAYEGWYHSWYGAYSTGRFPENLLYARVSDFVDCKTVKLPAYERPLCATGPAPRSGDYYYAWGPGSPVRWYQPPPGKTTWQVLADYNRRVIKQEPFSYAAQTVGDALRGFAWGRNGDPQNLSGEVVHWRFNTTGHDPANTHVAGEPPPDQLHINKPLARVLHFYSDIYVPGPLYAACLLAGLAAAAGIGRARRSGLRSSAFLFSVSCAGLLLVSTAVSIFSWRYQMVEFVLLPPAGALGLTALLRRRDPDGLTFGESVRALFRRRPARVRSAATQPT